MNSSLDKFNPTLSASFATANLTYVSMLASAVISGNWDWSLPILKLFLWLFCFIAAIAISYPILLLLSPLYFRISHKFSLFVFSCVGIMVGSGLVYLSLQIPKLASGTQKDQYTTMAIFGFIGLCSAIASWRNIRKYEIRHQNIQQQGK